MNHKIRTDYFTQVKNYLNLFQLYN